MLDVDGDGKFDIVSLADGDVCRPDFPQRSVMASSRKSLQAQFGLALKGKGVSCAVGDYDNDGKNDLAVALSDRVLLFHNDGGGKFTDVTEKAGITHAESAGGHDFRRLRPRRRSRPVRYRSSAGAVRRDSTDNVVWRNNGNGTFTNWTTEAGFGGEGATTSVTLSDINNDRAVDLVVTAADGAPTVYLNQREGPFKAMPLYDAARSATGNRRLRLRLQQRRLDGRSAHTRGRAGGEPVAQCRWQAIRARATARYRCDERLGPHCRRLRQRWLDRPGCGSLRRRREPSCACSATRARRDSKTSARAGSRQD